MECPLCPRNAAAGRFSVQSDFQAFYNIAPIVRGHVLVAPLRHVRSLTELDEATRRKFFDYAFLITQLVLEKTNTKEFDWALQDGVNAGQTVGHLHLHILPRKQGDLERAGSWFISLYGPEAAAPESEHRPRLTDDELREAVAWLTTELHSRP